MGKKAKADDSGRLARLRRMTPFATTFLWPTLLLLGGYTAWLVWGEERVGDVAYRLTPQSITIPKQPAYIRSDLKREVFDATGLDQISLLDHAAAAQIAQAFETHPWVDSVLRVQKLPNARVDVQLDYRRPVAMVEVQSHPAIPGPGYYAVDQWGYLLPPDDFASAETAHYVHIVFPDDVHPNGSYGSRFGDRRVEAAARLAALIGPQFETLQIRAITADVRPDIPGDRVPLKLVLTDGRTVLWGNPPGDEQPGELTAAGKLERLSQTETLTDGEDLRSGETRAASGRLRRSDERRDASGERERR